MLEIKYHKQFKKDLKKAKARNLDVQKLLEVIKILANGQTLDSKYKPHSLKGNYSGYMECHVEPDWLLVYKIDNNELILLLYRTGTHSDLF